MGKPSVTVIVSGPNEGTNSIYNTVVLKNRYPFAQQVTLPNTKYVVKYNFDLGLETMEMPSGCMLDFDGGSIYNGTIIGDDTVEINHSGVNVWGENLTKGGTWLLQHGGNVPADWSQEDPDAPDFINNKPNLATVATSGSYEDLSNTPNLADVATSGSYEDLNDKPNLADVAISGSYNDLSNKPSIPVVPSNVSAFTNDAGYLKSSDIEGKANSADLADVATTGNYDDLINKPAIPTVPSNVSAFTNDAGYLTSHQDISGKVNSSDLATVATTGNYNDLTNKPNIAAEQVQSDWNETNQSSKAYIRNKPSIPSGLIQADWNLLLSNEVDYIKNKPDIDAALQQKQDVIEDLTTIRADAYAGRRASLVIDRGIRMEDLSSSLERTIYTARLAYQKPANGIPSTDLDSDVQQSLTLANNAIPSSEKGANGGVATLDETGKVPSSQLPGSIDSILEYDSLDTAYISSNWPEFVPNNSYAVGATVKLTNLGQVSGWVCTTANTSSTIDSNWRAATLFPGTGTGSKIYVAIDTNKQYRWSGSRYTEISASLTLGITSGTAYEGSAGKALKDKLDGIEAGAQKNVDPTKNQVMNALGARNGTGDNAPSAVKFLNEQGSWTEISSERTTIVMDTLDAGSSSAVNKNLSFNAKYYLASIANTGTEAVNTLALPTDGVTKELDIYIFPVSATDKITVPLKITKSSDKQHIICADTGDEASEDFLKLNVGDIVHLYYMTSTQDAMRFLMYKYTVTSSVVDRTKVAKISLDTLISGFNAVIPQANQISSSDNAYAYLRDMYTLAKNEWDNLDSPLFKAETYPDASAYHGNNTQYWETTYSALQGWLMAMCLAELIPTKDTTGDAGGSYNIDNMSNNQTEIFKHGYSLGGGRSLPLYGDYAIDADPMIARMAAAAIYAKYHDAKASDITAARTALGGQVIPSGATDWSGLGVEYSDGSVGTVPLDAHITDYDTVVSKLGYIVNTHVIVPESPGPFAMNYGKPSAPVNPPEDLSDGREIPVSEDAGSFYSDNVTVDKDGGGTFTKDWYKYNYKGDVAIDKDVCETYLINALMDADDWKEDNSKDINLRTMRACMIADISNMSLFAKKRVQLKETDNLVVITDNCYVFEETETAPTDSNLVYDVSGIFADINDLSTKIIPRYSNGYPVYSNICNYLNTVRIISDNCRVPSMAQYCGRRRPTGNIHDRYARIPNDGSTDEENKGYVASKWNGINNGSIQSIFAEDTARTTEVAGEHDWVANDRATSYVSGHSAQFATLGLLLAQAVTDMDKKNSSEMAKYLKAIYEGCNLRVIGRYHWNSDTIYGRLFGTMILPIINAMSGLTSSYESAKAVINGGQSSGGSVEVNYNTVYEGGNSSTGSITIVVHNDSGSEVTFTQIQFLFQNELISSGGMEVGDTVASGSSTTLNYSLNSFNIGKLDKTLDKPQLYVNGAYVDCNAFSSGTFQDGATYDVYYGGSTASTVTAGGGGGSGTVSTTKLKLVINNNSGSTLTAANQLNFLVNNSGSVIKVGRITLDNAISLTNGQSGTYIGTLSSAALTGKPFASSQDGYVADGDNFGSNIILYDSNGTALYNLNLPAINPANASLGFQPGATYTINYGGGSSPNPTPTPVGNRLISINLNITNSTGSTVELDGDLNMVLGNPDRNGNYFTSGVTTSYIRLDPHLVFSNSKVTLTNGQSLAFNNISWADRDTGVGLGDMSPADSATVTIASRHSNVLIYVNGSSEGDISPTPIYCQMLSSDTVFTQGGTYNIVLVSTPPV